MPVNTDIQIQQHSGYFLFPPEKSGKIHLDRLLLPRRTAAGSPIIFNPGKNTPIKTFRRKSPCSKAFSTNPFRV